MNDAEAWGWVTQYTPMLVTLVGGSGVAKSDFDDRLHDAILEMYRRMVLHRDGGLSERNYAYRSAHRAAQEVLRLARWQGYGRRSKPQRVRRIGDTDIEEEYELPWPATQPTGEQRVALGEVLDALSTAPERVADTVARYAVGEYLREIGASYGVTVGRVSQLLRMGRDVIEREVGDGAGG